MTCKTGKREDYISWDDYFMGIALLSAQRSKDPSTQVGACIVNDDNVIVGTGYNGWPRGIDNDDLPWEREGAALQTKYMYVVHAEANAITNASVSLKGCRIYVALIPCNECAKLIIQSGITEVVYMNDKHAALDAFKGARVLFEKAGVRLRQYRPQMKRLTLDFEEAVQ